MVRVGINGFGRIGRMVFRAGMNNPDIEFVAVNDLTDTKTLAHLLKHDSVQGNLQNSITYDDHNIFVDGKPIRVYAEKDPANIPWGEHAIETVLECTGFFTTKEKASAHLNGGAKRVIISAPAKDDETPTYVLGINEHDITGDEIVMSNASCTSNSLAPMVKVLHDNFEIMHGLFTTVHSYTGDQRIVDGPHKDLRRARAAAVNIVPTSSGAAIAVTKAIPELDGLLTGHAVRVPTPVGSLTEFTCHVKKHVTVEEINQLFKNVSEHHLKGILRYSEEPLVSSDIVGDPHSCIFDAGQTEVVNGHMVRVVGWYDNEWGYSNRLVELMLHASGCPIRR